MLDLSPGIGSLSQDDGSDAGESFTGGPGTDGLDYFNARYYSPAQGRFVSPDPGNAGADLGNPQTWNGYAYAGNNPVNVADPDGKSWFSIFAGVVAGIATMNPGFGLAVAGTFNTFESAVSGHPPGFGLPGVSDFAGCGGPLGNCGTFGGIWTEESVILPAVQDPGRFVMDATKSDPVKIGGCLVKGAAVGAAGALVVGGLAIGAATVGVPAAVVTGGLLLGGAVGGYFTGRSVINNVRTGNYAGLAYDAGSVMGGVAAGFGVGGRVGDAINPPASRGWSLGRDWSNRFDPSKGSVKDWLATGPDAGAAAGATGFWGSGIGRFLKSTTGGC